MVKIIGMSEMLVIMCTCPDEAMASELASGLVEGRLAACVNILPGIRSTYRWQGETCNDVEVLMVIKSLACRYQELESWLLQNHPYDTPEIVALPVSRVSDGYLEWIGSSIGA